MAPSEQQTSPCTRWQLTGIVWKPGAFAIRFSSGRVRASERPGLSCSRANRPAVNQWFRGTSRGVSWPFQAAGLWVPRAVRFFLPLRGTGSWTAGSCTPQTRLTLLQLCILRSDVACRPGDQIHLNLTCRPAPLTAIGTRRDWAFSLRLAGGQLLVFDLDLDKSASMAC